MKKSQTLPGDAAELRRSAEARLSEKQKSQRSEAGDQRTAEDTARLVHELQVHQIELEMQNEELKQARAKADELMAQYTDLYDFAPAGYLTLDREGAIRLVNLTGVQMLGIERSRLVKRRFGQFVAEGDRRAFSDFLQKVFASEAEERCEVTLPREGLQPLVVQIKGTRSADGQECRAMLLDITERKRAETAIAVQLDELRRWHRATLGREGRVLEMKQEVNELLAKLGQPPRYPSASEVAVTRDQGAVTTTDGRSVITGQPSGATTADREKPPR